MPSNRPAVPVALQRQLKEEAGYRCAIPACGQTTGLELAHIEPWSKVREHTFDNMICLCSICHYRYDQVGDIPRLSILRFKQNLGLLSHRYTQVENQVLRHYGKIAAAGLRPADYRFAIHPGMTILFTGLFEDKLFTQLPSDGTTFTINGVEPNIYIVPTNHGSDFITRMVEATDLED